MANILGIPKIRRVYRAKAETAEDLIDNLLDGNPYKG